MRRLTLIVGLALACASLAACAAHPIVARDPVEPPSPGEAYDCDSRPTVLNAFSTGCEERQRRTGLRLKG